MFSSIISVSFGCQQNTYLFRTLLERDTDGECMFVWVYPKIEDDLRTTVLDKCNILLEEHNGTTFCFCQSKGVWYYILRSDVSQTSIKNVGLNKFYF